jgi:hypothetical protein
VDASSGLISGTLDPGTGSYAVEVRADDGNSFDGESFLWDVGGGNQPPVWTDPGPQSDAEGAAVSLQLSATNPDGPPPSYSASGLPPGLSVDSGSGLVSGMLGFDAAGVHPVTATASDEVHDVEQPFGWTVTNTNRAPVWTDPGAQSHEEGEGVSIPLIASDPDGEDVDFSAAGLPPGLSIDSETGVVSGTLGYESAGEYSVTATATDGADPADQPFTWSVADAFPPSSVPVTSPLGLAVGLLAIGSVGVVALRRRQRAKQPRLAEAPRYPR